MTVADDLVVVTGGAGYIGSHLVRELLGAGARVRVVDSLAVGTGSSLTSHWGHPRFEFLRGDVRESSLRDGALTGATSVVHLAAVVGDPACARDQDLAREVNVDATRAWLDAARLAGGGRFLFASTCSNYGKMADPDAFATEDWELRPVSLYAETKVAAEIDVLGAGEPGFSTTCLRFATIYGTSPRMRFDLTVNEFTRDAVLSGALVVYGEQFWRPYVHVRDAARAIVMVLEAPPEAVAGEVFNVGDTGQQFRKQDLVELLVAKLPETTVERVERTEDPRDYRVSFEKVKAALGFETTRTVPDGIDEMLELLRSGAIQDPFSLEYRN